MTPEHRRKLYFDMLRLRIVEERIAELYPAQEMRCPVHLYTGQEAVAVGVSAALRADDYVLSNHRSHGHYLAKGGDLKAMMAEVYGRATGCAGGNGGSMHLVDLKVNFLGAAPIIGSTIPIGVGAALGARMRAEDRVSVVYFGDTGVETGVFYESLNYAVLHRLPVIFVCENNLYSVYTSLAERQPANRQICDVSAAMGARAAQADGNDVEAVHIAASDAVAAARRGEGPSFLEFMTYRWREHVGPNFDNHIGYRTEAEFAEWKARCPVDTYRTRLIEAGILSAADADAAETRLADEMDAAVEFAKSSPFPPLSQLTANIFAA